MTTPAIPVEPASLSAAYASAGSMLPQDLTSPTGKVPVMTGPSSTFSDPASGTAPVALNPPVLPYTESELAAQSPDYFAESAFPHAGPWPSLPVESQGKEPFGTLPPDGITPIGSYKVPPEIIGLAQYKEAYPGHDAHSQDTDTLGWDQYTPSGRTAIRQSWFQNYLGVEDFWPITQPNLARTRVAMGGNQNVGGVVAAYGDISASGENTAYETPPLPEITQQQPETAAASTIPQWGF